MAASKVILHCRRPRPQGLVLAALAAAAASAAFCCSCFAGGHGVPALRPAAAGRLPLIARQGNMIQIPGDIKNGQRLIIEGIPVSVMEFLSKKQGKGVAFTKAKLRNLVTGAIVEKTLSSGSKFEEVETFFKRGTFSYFDEQTNSYVLMDTETFETFPIAADILGELGEWLTEGMYMELESWETKVIGVKVKGDLILEVAGVTPMKDNKRDCTCVLSNGITRSGPPYLQVGDKVLIDKTDFRIIKRLSAEEVAASAVQEANLNGA
ncbi:unnamed protein product [Polarella glacialis]|uniref:Translation elongation factor P/YeiP central domain-containing protein n=1 Tax=Polarella glacialis TaxID=89957 RepID=A0A813GUC0_POLGL|nr:unnamed protein product [Polarella glacialis]